jgi:hypothetical protein
VSETNPKGDLVSNGNAKQGQAANGCALYGIKDSNGIIPSRRGGGYPAPGWYRLPVVARDGKGVPQVRSPVTGEVVPARRLPGFVRVETPATTYERRGRLRKGEGSR